MAQTHKYSVMVVIKDSHGTSRTITPIIEAISDTEAKRIAIAQYPDASVRTVSKIN